MSEGGLRVLISGAGIAGSCCAYWLAKIRYDVSITIVERSPTPRVTGQSIDMHGPAVEVLKKMQLEEAVLAMNTTEKGTAIVGPSGKYSAIFDTDDTFTSKYEILRADLSKLFLDATDRLKNIRYVYGDSIKSLNQTDDAVNVTFNGGSLATFDVVIAADGAMSRTRPMILDEEILKDCYTPIGQYAAFFSIPSQPSDPKLWEWYNTPKGLCVMTRPHRTEGTIGAYLCITLPSRGQMDPEVEAALKEGPEGQKRLLHKYFDNVGWKAQRVLEGMDKADDFYMSRTAQVKLSKWTNGRALVLGDAAFATQGVGTSLAIESAYVLAGELSKIQSNKDVPQALIRYEEVFRTLYSKRADMPDLFPQIAFPQSAWRIKLLRSALWFASKTKVHKLFPSDEAIDWKLPEYNWVSVEG